jgi:hypothetical protein
MSYVSVLCNGTQNIQQNIIEMKNTYIITDFNILKIVS